MICSILVNIHTYVHTRTRKAQPAELMKRVIVFCHSPAWVECSAHTLEHVWPVACGTYLADVKEATVCVAAAAAAAAAVVDAVTCEVRRRWTDVLERRCRWLRQSRSSTELSLASTAGHRLSQLLKPTSFYGTISASEQTANQRRSWVDCRSGQRYHQYLRSTETCMQNSDGVAKTPKKISCLIVFFIRRP